MINHRDQHKTGTSALFSSRNFWIAAIIAGLTGLTAANAHLVMIAIASQPACVEHHKERGDAPGAYRAAKSACASRPEDK